MIEVLLTISNALILLINFGIIGYQSQNLKK